ncbi:hornerin-like [Haliotis rubra]|uniref:hornerin-like n=1 Tax=Haliotis rubra TaxID=36100 RepID=UPI001EE57724|nr:hornerin-like [Haliotis rubra]
MARMLLRPERGPDGTAPSMGSGHILCDKLGLLAALAVACIVDHTGGSASYRTQDASEGQAGYVQAQGAGETHGMGQKSHASESQQSHSGMESRSQGLKQSSQSYSSSYSSGRSSSSQSYSSSSKQTHGDAMRKSSSALEGQGQPDRGEGQGGLRGLSSASGAGQYSSRGHGSSSRQSHSYSGQTQGGSTGNSSSSGGQSSSRRQSYSNGGQTQAGSMGKSYSYGDQVEGGTMGKSYRSGGQIQGGTRNPSMGNRAPLGSHTALGSQLSVRFMEVPVLGHNWSKRAMDSLCYLSWSIQTSREFSISTASVKQPGELEEGTV